MRVATLTIGDLGEDKNFVNELSMRRPAAGVCFEQIYLVFVCVASFSSWGVAAVGAMLICHISERRKW